MERNKLYKIESGVATLAGSGYPVSGFRLVLAHNTVPRLELSIDPIHLAADASGVVLSDFDNLVTRFNNGNSGVLRRGGPTGSFSFRMLSTDGDEQALDIEDWPITNIGLGSFSLGATTNFTVTLEHPAINLNNDSMRFVGLSADARYTGPKFNTVLDGLREALTWLKDRQVVENLSPPAALLQSRMGEMAEDLGRYLTWEGAGWPVIGGRLDDYIHHALLAVLQGYSHVTPLQFLQHVLTQEWDLNIIPTYADDKLVIGPFNPWAAASVTIADNDITQVAMPSLGSRVAGVVTLNTVASLAGYTAIAWPDGVSQELASESGYIDESLAGSILVRQAPQYLSAALQAASATSTNTAFAVGDAQYADGDVNRAVSAPNSEYAAPLKAFLERYCKQRFCTAFLQDRSVSMTTRLLLDIDPIPGRVAEIKSSAGSLLGYFLVAGVEHVVDSNMGIANTIVSGAYMHTASQVAGVEAVEARKNHIYAG